jgi:Ca2+-binding RTX toxin-like protein
VLVGAPQADRNGRTNSGTAYAVWGRSSSGSVDAGALGASGFAIDGVGAGDGLGSAVALTRDLTGDGLAEAFAGARTADPLGRTDAGAAYVVAGRSGSGAVDLAQPAAAIYQANGAAAGDAAGAVLAEGGDLDGNGTPDLLVGAPGTDYNGRSGSGSVYAILGTARGGSHDLATLDSAWRIDGAAAGDGVGLAFSAGADLNADGRADLAIGDQLQDTHGRVDSGLTRVLFGGGFGGVIDLATTTAPGFHADGGATGDWSGSSVAALPDVTGDGHPDLVIGAARSDHLGRNDSGSAYVLYGWGTARLSYPAAGSTTVGQPLPPLGPAGVARTGPVAYSIAPALPAGLVLDARTGVISGAPAAVLDEGAQFTLTMTDLSGTVSVPIRLRVAPRPGPCANPHDGTNAADRIVGTSGGDKVNGGEGTDSVTGMGGDDCLNGEADGDLLYGGDGADQLSGGVGQDILDGGSGNDALNGDDGQDQMTGDDGDDVLHGGRGFDEISGGNGNDRLYGEQDTDVLDGGAGNDLLDGGANPDKLIGGAGNDTLIGGSGNDIILDRSGSNRVSAGSGNDRIDVRNRRRDVVNCGAGRDSVSADRIDKLVGCERVKRSGPAHGKSGRRR